MFFPRPTPTPLPALAVPPPSACAQILSADWGARKIPVSKGGHIRGHHPVRPDHDSVPFESLGECRAISLFAGIPEMERISAQPVTIQYRYGNRVYKYTPDFMLEWSEVPLEWRNRGFGKTSFVECKPLGKALSQVEKLSRNLAAIAALEKGPLIFLTERELVCWGGRADAI
jgi:hypothetical protein